MTVGALPTLAVLITYCGEGALLSGCLDSILTQPQAPDEVVVYDDASAVPANAFVASRASVRIVRGDVRRGPAHGRNTLLRMSESDYVHFHDADDLFHPGWSRRVRQAIASGAPDVVVTEIASCRGGKPVCDRVLGLDRWADGDDPVRFSLRGAVLTSAVTCRRLLALRVGGYREALAQSEDFDFHVRLAAAGPRWRMIRDPLVLQRLRPSSHSASGRVAVWTSMMKSVWLLSDELPPAYRPELADAAARAGSMLYRLGAYAETRRAFSLSRALGPPGFHGRRRLYRLLARVAGPLIAERVGRWYRGTLPQPVRAYLVSRGW